MPYAIHLIASIFVLHNYLIDTRDSVREADLLPHEVTEQLQNFRLDPEENELDAATNNSDDREDLDDEDNIYIGQGLRGDDGPVTQDILLRHIIWRDNDK